MEINEEKSRICQGSVIFYNKKVSFLCETKLETRKVKETILIKNKYVLCYKINIIYKYYLLYVKFPTIIYFNKHKRILVNKQFYYIVKFNKNLMCLYFTFHIKENNPNIIITVNFFL